MKEIRYRRDLWKLFTRQARAVEVGVAEGNFSEDMLRWNLQSGKPALTQLYLVDRWLEVPTQQGDASMLQSWHDRNLFVVRQRIEPFGKRAVILRGHSVQMAAKVPDQSLWLVYIDGDHSYEGCFADTRAWAPKVKPGGYIAFHDYLNMNYGVNAAVNDFARASKFEIHTIHEDKDEDAGALIQLC